MALAALVAACQGPGADPMTAAPDGGTVATGTPPVVLGLSPLSGHYGTAVTIDGEGFAQGEVRVHCTDESGRTLQVGASYASLDVDLRSTVLSWSDTRIVMRYPFPCSGPLTLKGPGGQAQTAAFQPLWRSGGAYPLAKGSTLMASASLAGGRLALAFRQAGRGLWLMLAAAGAWQEHALPLGSDARELVLFADAAGELEGLLLSAESPAELLYLHWQNGGPQVERTGLKAAADVGAFLAGGRDSSGVYAWVRQSAGVSRFRLKGTWTADRGPIALAGGATAYLAAAGADGSLAVSRFDERMVLPLQYQTYVEVAWLLPAATSFSSWQSAGIYSGKLEASSRMHISPDGHTVFVMSCENLDASSPPKVCSASSIVDQTGRAYAIGIAQKYSWLAAREMLNSQGAAQAFYKEPLLELQLTANVASAPLTSVPLWPGQPYHAQVGATGALDLLLHEWHYDEGGDMVTALYHPSLSQPR